MTPREFHKLALELSARDDEASLRSATSRAYYAVFHASREFLGRLGFQLRQSDQAHAAIYRRLTGSKDVQLRKAGDSLMQLKRLRNRADYDISQPYSTSEARTAVQEAALLMTRIDGFIDEKQLAEITQRIREYERDVLREVTWQSTN